MIFTVRQQKRNILSETVLKVDKQNGVIGGERIVHRRKRTFKKNTYYVVSYDDQLYFRLSTQNKQKLNFFCFANGYK